MTSPYLMLEGRTLAAALLARAHTQRQWAAVRGASTEFVNRSMALARAYETAAAKAMQGVFPFDNDNEATT